MFFSRATSLTASATPEFGTSTITSTLSSSIPLRGDARADVGLVLVVAADDLDLHALGWPGAESSTAIFAAATEPGPPRSA